MPPFTGLILALVWWAPADVSPQLRAEVVRVRESASKVVAQEQRGGLETRLKRAEDALAARRFYLALLELQPAWEMEAGFAFSAASGVKTSEEFLRKWKEVGVPPLPSAPSTPSRPLVIEALADSAEARGPAVYRASLPSSEDAGLPAGLYYLGESQAVGRFAAFIRGLGWESRGPRPALRSVEKELTAFENQVVKAYETTPTDRRQSFIGVNVALKLARELEAQRRYAAALLEYLRARYRFAAASPPAADPATVRPRVAAMQQQLEGADHSIALLFLELAAANVDNSDPSVARTASAVLDDVIPAYLAIVKP